MKESKIETAKRNSRYLRGGLAETLPSGADHFGKDDIQVLKFHGVYQQDDRDQRKLRIRGSQDKAYQFMVRLVLPAGILSAEQYLALDELSERYADGSLRITTRQGIQFHGVLMGNLKATLADVDATLLTTLGACGDVERNVMACPAPLDDRAHRVVQQTARDISLNLRPQTRAYYDIWIDGEKHTNNGPAKEDFYGEAYLPRKLKTGIAIENDNCVDVFTCDIGLLATLRNGRVAGFDLLVGGGMGMTHNKPETIARLADPIGNVAPEEAVEAVRTVAAIFRDHGNRVDRRQARLKYLLERWGIERFREEFHRRTSIRLGSARQPSRIPQHDHLGAQRQGDGRWFYGVFVENGRIVDRNGLRLKTALREIISRFRPGVHNTPQQNLLLTNLTRQEVERATALLAEHGVLPAEGLTGARRFSMACPALPTCGLALGESERLLPSVIDSLDVELDRLGLSRAPISVRMTGCPNGCARPYVADLAFVARSPSSYHIYVGGRLEGDRIADLFAADVAPDDFVPRLLPLLKRWARERHPGEALGDFYQRLAGCSRPRRRITGQEEAVGEQVLLQVAI